MDFLHWVLGLYKLGQNNNSVLEESELFQTILEYIVEGFDADCGSLAFLTPDYQEFKLIAGIDLPEGVVGSKVSVSESRMGCVVHSNSPCLYNDKNVEKSSRVSSAMCWPLNGHDGILGALNINRGRLRPAYNEEDLEQGKVIISLISVVIENAQLHRDYQCKIDQLEKMNSEIKSVNTELDSARNQLLQSEKLASIGQLAAGVAHEINNPVGFIYSNLSSLSRYHSDLFKLLHVYEAIQPNDLSDDSLIRIQSVRKDVDIKFIQEDINELMLESQDGVGRVKQIVQDLKDFSYVDGAGWQWVDLHKGIDSTLNMLRNELKGKIDIIKDYADLPEVECLPSQINQVFMNIISNAVYAIETQGQINITSGLDGDKVWVSFTDNGNGIADSDKNRIFDPFFTTRPVGKGTGLGLSLSYGIIEKHGGKITVESDPGKGSVFTVWLPVSQGKDNELMDRSA